MNFARHHRTVIALLLYSCVLFSSFACALGHGQSSGLQLSGISQLQCGSGANAGQSIPAAPQAAFSFDCPVCSGHQLAPGPLGVWALQLPVWLPSPLPAISIATATLAAAPWPPANPRAPPLV